MHSRGPTLVSAAGGGSSFSWPASALEVWVDYANGSDSNTGLGPSAAFKTIQAAYNAVKAKTLATYTADTNGYLGAGRVYLLPGDHDVDGGVTCDPRYPVELIGGRAGVRRQISVNSQTRIVSTSNPTYFLDYTDNVRIAVGAVFRDLGFVVDHASANSSTLACIRYSGTHPVVENCQWDTLGSTNTTTLRFFYHVPRPDTDSAWLRMTNCVGGRMCMYDITGGNANGMYIAHNVSFYDGDGTLANINCGSTGELYRSNVSFNELSGASTGVLLDNTVNNANRYSTFDTNAGEDSSGGTRPFYDIGPSGGFLNFNRFLGGHCSAETSPGAADINGTWARFGANAHSNMVDGRVDLTGTVGQKWKVVDNATVGVRFDSPFGIYRGGDGLQFGATGHKIGFMGATPVVRQTVSGSRGSNAALASALTALATLGLITDSSS